MFKLTKGGSGLRRAAGGGGSAQGRIGGIPGKLTGRNHMPLPLKPAFVPDLQAHGLDSSSPRISEVGETKQGWTGSGIGA